MPHSCASKCVGRETKARNYMQYEQPLGEGARQRRRMDVPRRGTLLRSGQYANCAKRYSVSSLEAKPRDLCCARMRRNEQAENESTILHMIRVGPWRRGAPKAQDRCASKRHPSTQRSVCQLCKAPLRIVISSEARNLCHSRPSDQ